MIVRRGNRKEGVAVLQPRLREASDCSHRRSPSADADELDILSKERSPLHDNSIAGASGSKSGQHFFGTASLLPHRFQALLGL